MKVFLYILMIIFIFYGCSDLPDNQAPTVFTLSAPETGAFVYLTPASSIQFQWSAAIDPEDDPITYQLILSTVDESGKKDKKIMTIDSITDTTITVSRSQFDSTLTQQDTLHLMWQINAIDEENITPCETPYYFTLKNVDNMPPESFQLQYPEDQGWAYLLTNNDSIQFQWDIANDADSEHIIYHFALFLADGDSIFGMETVETSITISQSQLEPYLVGQDTIHLSWQVSATDGFTTTLCQQPYSFGIRTTNYPPEPFDLSTPDHNQLIVIQNASDYVEFSWQQAIDPEEKPITYRWILANTPTLDDVISSHEMNGQTTFIWSTDEIGTIAQEQGTKTIVAFWGIQATDGEFIVRSTSTHAIQVTIDTPPQPFTLQTPADHTRLFVHSRSFGESVSWRESHDPDGDVIIYRWLLDLPGNNFANPLLSRSTIETQFNLAANSLIELMIDQNTPDANFIWNVFAKDIDDNQTQAETPFNLRVTLDLRGTYHLLTPTNETTITITDSSQVIPFTWEACSDFEGDKEYILKIANENTWDSFQAPLFSIVLTNETQINLDGATLLSILNGEQEFTGFWTVYAMTPDIPIPIYRSIDSFGLIIN